MYLEAFRRQALPGDVLQWPKCRGNNTLEMEFQASARQFRWYHQRDVTAFRSSLAFPLSPLPPSTILFSNADKRALLLPSAPHWRVAHLGVWDQQRQHWSRWSSTLVSLKQSFGEGSGFCSSPLSFWQMPEQVLSLPLLFLDRGMGTLCSFQAVFESS